MKKLHSSAKYNVINDLDGLQRMLKWPWNRIEKSFPYTNLTNSCQKLKISDKDKLTTASTKRRFNREGK